MLQNNFTADTMRLEQQHESVTGLVHQKLRATANCKHVNNITVTPEAMSHGEL